MFVIKQRPVGKTLGDGQPPSPAHTMYAAAAWTTRTPPSIHCPMEDHMPSASLGHHCLGCTPRMFLPWDLCTHSSHCWEHTSSNTHTACSPDRKKTTAEIILTPVVAKGCPHICLTFLCPTGPWQTIGMLQLEGTQTPHPVAADLTHH